MPDTTPTFARVGSALRGTTPPVRSPLVTDPPPSLAVPGTEAAEPSVPQRLAEIEAYLAERPHSFSDDQRTLAGMFLRTLRALARGQRNVVREIQELDARAPDLDVLADPVAPPAPGLPAAPVVMFCEERAADAAGCATGVVYEIQVPHPQRRLVRCAGHAGPWILAALRDGLRFTVLPIARMQ
jgi:hypothetical protein